MLEFLRGLGVDSLDLSVLPIDRRRRSSFGSITGATARWQFAGVDDLQGSHLDSEGRLVTRRDIGVYSRL
jgi:hypothetical protein